MPSNLVVFPIGSSEEKLVDTSGVTYDVSSHLSTRTGEDGAIKVLYLNTGDNFIGETLGGQWHKGWSSGIGGSNQPYTAILDTTNGLVEFKGEAASAGSYGYGWINSKNPIVLLDGTELITELEVPTSDVGSTENRVINNLFLLNDSYSEDTPGSGDFIRFLVSVSDTGLLCFLQHKVDGSVIQTWRGTTDEYSSTRDESADMFWKVKFVFNGKPGTSGATMTVYVKHGSTRANMEADSWTQLKEEGGGNLTVDVSNNTFDVSYPSYRIDTQNDTYFDDSNEAKSTGFSVSYPNFTTESTGGTTADVKLYDGDPDDGGTEVTDITHEFENDPYIQNGLIRLHVDELVDKGCKLQAYLGGSWTALGNWEIYDNTRYYAYPNLLSVVRVSPEKCVIKLRLLNSDVVDEDYYIDYTVTLLRGSYYIEFEETTTYPLSNHRTQFRTNPSTRFGYIGDDTIGDNDINLSSTNSILSDNFMVCLDDEGNAVLVGFACENKPDDAFRTYKGEWLHTDDTDVDTYPTKFWVFLSPFSNNSDLFKEVEDATISANARLYFDGTGEDTVTENNDVWTNTTNCAVDENNTAEESVGDACVDISSSDAGEVVATCTPASPLGKLTKFDTLKLYLHGDPDTDVTIRLVDADGDSVTKEQAVTGSATQYTIDLPHADDDLQGWTEVDTYDFETLTTLTIEWTAAGAGEHVYVDGFHEYIGTTTTRGRGETLSGGSAVVFDDEEELQYRIDAGTNIPAGRYLFVVRAKDTEQVANDFRQRIWNMDDGGYQNEVNSIEQKTLSSSFTYYSQFFHITDSDVTGIDDIQFKVDKYETDENTIFVDYFLIIPIGDGENLPQDLAHDALRYYERDSNVTIPHSDDLTFRKDFTTNFWIKPYAINDNEFIVGKGEANDSGWLVYTSNNDLLFDTYQAGTTQTTVASACISTDTWKHVSVVRDGTVANIYVNGKDVTSTRESHEDPDYSSNDMILGMRSENAGSFNGALDNVTIFSKALTADEVGSIYNIEKRGSPYEEEMPNR